MSGPPRGAEPVGRALQALAKGGGGRIGTATVEHEREGLRVGRRQGADDLAHREAEVAGEGDLLRGLALIRQRDARIGVAVLAPAATALSERTMLPRRDAEDPGERIALGIELRGA